MIHIKKNIFIADNEEMREFYLYQLEQISDDPNLFTNDGLNLVLNDSYFKENK